MRPLEVTPFASRPLAGGFDDASYDAVIAALGYEKRARRISEKLADRTEAKVAIAFSDHTDRDDYKENERFFESADFAIERLGQLKISGWMKSWLAALAENSDRPLSLAIDVSSLSRVRIARLLAPLTAHKLDSPVSVDFLYTPAGYEPAGVEPEITEVNGPVTEWFSGWAPNPRRAVVAFVGLGYEPDRATGAIEHIEPGFIWAFTPGGEDARYDDAMHEANKWLFEDLQEMEDRILGYEVNDPFACYATLEGLVFDELLRGRRPVLVPMGPKIFALVSMLVALRHRPWPAVWRLSPGDYAAALPRDSGGKLVGIRVVFPPF